MVCNIIVLSTHSYLLLLLMNDCKSKNLEILIYHFLRRFCKTWLTMPHMQACCSDTILLTSDYWQLPAKLHIFYTNVFSNATILISRSFMLESTSIITNGTCSKHMITTVIFITLNATTSYSKLLTYQS